MVKSKKNPEDNLIYILPLILAAAIVPLIVFLKVVPLDELSKLNWPTDNCSDFFSYYKAQAIMLSAVGVLLLSLYKIYRQGIYFKKVNIYIPAGIYAIFVILSTALSKYMSVSVDGFADRFEGIYTLISYIVLLLAAVNFLNSEKQIRIFLAALLVSSAVIGLIGIFQFFGLDFFKSMFGKLLILPAKYHSYAETLTFLFGEFTIYSTLYNTNFVGSYMAMLLPISLVLFVAAKRIAVKISLGLLTALMYANLIGCRSRAGYLGGIMAVFVLLVFFWKELKKNIVSIASTEIAFVLIFVIMNAASGGSLGNRDFLESGSGAQQAGSFGFDDIQLNGKEISITGTEEALTIELYDNQMLFKDTDDKELELGFSDNGKIAVNDPRYKGIDIYQDTERSTYIIVIGNKQLDLYVDKEGFKVIGQRGVLVNKIEDVRKFGFEGRELLGSSRGYIWSRSIPLLKDSIVVGSGPDTYALVFPQYDVVGKLKGFNKVNEIVDKPHNMYLQIGINTGVLSLLAVIALFAIYLISCIKLYIGGKPANLYRVVGIAVCAAVCGYLTAAFFNDSLVSVAPVFWVLLGLGFSCNYYNKRAAGSCHV